jgi:EAL domain-containing protein (putative c-di-GMP-specific phosphodiesterase class I)
VLLVDDEPELLAGLRLALRKEPFDLLTASSGREGLALLEQHPVALVVSDERMPEMPGSVFLTEVRLRHPDVERVVLTGQASMEATIAAINDARVFRFLTKPCRPDELATAIRDGLEVAAARGPLRPPPGPSGGPLGDDALGRSFDEALPAAWIAFQPIVSAATFETVAYEALVRSRHALLSSPAALIDAASRLDRNFALDRAVRAKVAAVIRQAPTDVSVFVNILPQSLDDPSLTGDDNPLLPFADRVVWEITERSGLEGLDDAVGRARRLRERGYRIALDDLGAGHSGLNSIALLEPDVVKLDMTLVRDIHRSPTRSKLVASMVELCHELGTTCLAEGIETDDELEHVIGLGCELLQGYRLGRPGPPFVDARLA